MFFLAIYNEEILAGGTGSESMTKKVEEIRIPSVRYPSLYQDLTKIQTFPEVSLPKYNNTRLFYQVDFFCYL